MMKKLSFHPAGMRIVKTGAAVALCLTFYMLMGYSGQTMPAEAAITAIICMQPCMGDSAESALNRLLGTAIGACWGFIFLLTMAAAPALGESQALLYALMGLGTLVAMHSAVLLGKADASGLVAIVFVCVVVAYPDVGSPMDQAFRRMLDVLLGTAVAIAVNAVRLPRRRMRGKVFFLPLSSLAEDEYEQLPPAVLFRLQKLCREGARICLVSEHAPTVQTAQLAALSPGVPMIVMDGAAVYDARENVYLAASDLNPVSARWLMKRLDAIGAGYFIYTVHADRNCIYHRGAMTAREEELYRCLRRSPYRHYLDGEHFSVSDIVYIKLVTSRTEAERIRAELSPSLEKMKLRAVIRPQTGKGDGCGLYFYALHADISHAREHLMRLMRQTDPGLEECCVGGPGPYPTQKDAIRTLRALEDEYEPVALPGWPKRRGDRADGRGEARDGVGGEYGVTARP